MPAIKTCRILGESCCRLLLLILPLALVGGCSVNGFGLVSDQLIPGEGTIVRQRKAPGLHLEVSRDTTALSFGYWHDISVFSTDCPEQSFSHFSLTDSYGLLFSSFGREVDFTLGFRQRAKILSIPEGEVYSRTIAFQASDLPLTQLQLGSAEDCRS